MRLEIHILLYSHSCVNSRIKTKRICCYFFVQCLHLKINIEEYRKELCALWLDCWKKIRWNRRITWVNIINCWFIEKFIYLLIIANIWKNNHSESKIPKSRLFHCLFSLDDVKFRTFGLNSKKKDISNNLLFNAIK